MQTKQAQQVCRTANLLGNDVSQLLSEAGFQIGQAVSFSSAPGLISIGKIIQNNAPLERITSAQSLLLRRLAVEKIHLEEERECMIQSIPELSKREASAMITKLINNFA